eukprot:5406479-Amphidinium_carterae.1
MGQAFCVDAMHTFCLGLYPQLCSCVLCACLRSYVDLKDRKFGLSKLSLKLKGFYAANRSNATPAKMALPLTEKRNWHFGQSYVEHINACGYFVGVQTQHLG